MSLLTTWTPFFQSDIRRQGRGLQLAGQVARQAPTNGELVRARVTEQDDEHVVAIHEEQGGEVTAACTCSTFTGGRFCPHIWATLLDLQYTDDGPGAVAGDLTDCEVRPPKARKRQKAEPVRREAEPEWMGRLSLLRPSSEEVQRRVGDLLPKQRQICYVVLPGPSARHNGLVVTLRHRHALASGWSRPKPLKLTGDTLSSLADPVDRELGAMIVGGSWVNDSLTGDALRYERSHTTYRLAAGAERSLLKRMIDTGRAFMDLSEEADRSDQQPLTWAGDPPWGLWLVGWWDEPEDDVEAELAVNGEAIEPAPAEQPSSEPSPDAPLHLTLELRRGEQRVKIGEPALVLGGRDGLVLHQGRAAPLDDREAFHWISQFRHEFLAEDDDTRPMTVPRGDIDRFLDRLYMLPQLPELDLPEGLSEPEASAEATPNLELFSATSSEASELVSSGGTAKHQLVGRVWFDYAGQRVRPTQPGRFVPINPAAVNASPSDQSEQTLNTSEEPEQSRQNGEAGTPAPAGDTGATLSSDADDEEGETADTSETETSGGRQLIRRDARREREALAMLGSVGARQTAATANDAVLLPTRQLGVAVSELMDRGWAVTADRKALRAGGPPNLSIASGIDWFELRGTVQYERADGSEQAVTLPEILAAARSGEQMITLDDGTQGLLPEAWLAEHGLLTQMGEVEGDKLLFKPNQAALLDSLLGEKELTQVDTTFDQARQRLHQFTGIEPLDPAPEFHGTLRDYQREGLGWMAFLRWFGMGGILADDMGLGKTIQVLAVLQARHNGAPEHVKGDMFRPTTSEEDGAAHRPSLIVVPRSVVFNWVDEARKFTPDLRVMAYTGSQRQALREAFQDHDVIVTSYGLMRRDIEALRHFGFDYVVLDEAQAIKNPSSQAAKSARLLDAPHRLALTGTPIENHLGDLWSIFEFLNPGMLGASARFNDFLRAPGNSPSGNPAPDVPAPTASAVGDQAPANETQTQPQADDIDETADQPAEPPVKQIARALRPFILRRSKQQVLKDLPEKTEQTIVCQMESAQRQVYDELRQYYRGNLMQQLDQAGMKQGDAVGGQAFMVLEALLRLRQAACHPALIDEQRQGEASAKLEALEQMLGEVIDEGGKALVFSQFTSMLGLVKQRFDQLGISYVYLDGQTRNREEVIKQFQNDQSVQVFLISLKAGGFGLNLTAAEYVFILDPWWNPAVESQAIDRTHRIGQTRPVFAYRLICEETVEQRVIELQQAKRDLADAIVGGEENLLKSLSRDDLEQLLS